jgi:hypothetical protein
MVENVEGLRVVEGLRMFRVEIVEGFRVEMLEQRPSTFSTLNPSTISTSQQIWPTKIRRTGSRRAIWNVFSDQSLYFSDIQPFGILNSKSPPL